MALCGLGAAGARLHLPALRRIRAVELAVLCDPDTSTHRVAPRELVRTDWREALGPDIDAVVVATPPQTHFELTLAALQAGKHVYLEKPLATSLDEARRLCAAAEGEGLVLQIGYAFRYHPLWRRIHALVRRGKLRPPLTARCRFSALRSGSGFESHLVDLSCHHIDLMAWLLSHPPGEVAADAAGTLEAGWPDGSQLSGTYANGTFEDHVVIADRTTKLTADRLKHLRLHGAGMRMGTAGWPDPNLVMARLASRRWERSFEFAFNAFVAAARGEREVTPSARDGVAGVAVGEAILRSVQSGRTEPIESLESSLP